MAAKRPVQGVKKTATPARGRKTFKARQEDELEDALDDIRDAQRSLRSARRNVRRAINELND